MKKALVVFICIVLTVCTVFSVSATNAPTATVKASASEVLEGEYFTVYVSVDSCTDVGALGIEITYDNELCFTEGKWNTGAFSAGNNTVDVKLSDFNYSDSRGVIAFEVKDAEQNAIEDAGVTVSGVIAELKFLADGLSDAANIAVKVIPIDTSDEPVEIAQATTSVSVVSVAIQDGWNFIDGTWYYYENGVKVTNDWRKDSTGWCFLDEEGKWVIDAFVKDSVGLAYITKDGYFYYNTNGWVDYYGTWYYVENGYAVVSAWRKDSTGWCFLDENG
ncbi:MAG: hypothetical protein IJ292_04185, partial [Clostridia bacterium]|nr:hypothetical protein [Clostridia bacterium]